MPAHPWISIIHENEEIALSIHKISFCEIIPKDGDLRPSFLTFVGMRKKSIMLAQLLGHIKPMEHHGQVRLIHPWQKSDRGPEIYIDCELGHEDSIALDPQSKSSIVRPMGWMQPDAATNLPNLFISSVLAPLSNIICYFAADLHGLPGVSSVVAYQATRAKAHTLPFSALPHILVVFETRSNRFSSSAIQKKLLDQIIEKMIKLKDYSDAENADADLKTKFQSIQVVGLRKDLSIQERSDEFRLRLDSIKKDAYWKRTTSRHLFSAHHADTLAERILTRFSADNSCFNFLRESRPIGFSSEEFLSHLDEIIRLMPNASWLWGVVIPITASAIFLANYPPGSHAFLPSVIFEEFYESTCKEAIRKHTTDFTIHQRFISGIRKELEEMFRLFETDPQIHSAARQHVQRLASLGPHLADMKSMRSCFSCLALMPDKVLECGHAICNVCIRRFGQHSPLERHTYQISACILCGRVQPRVKSIFRLIPPSAGIRILCIDGGGVRGVIPLTFLQYLENQLGAFGCPLHEYFDYVCGTSAGGLIAIGIFLMRWAPQECLSRFEALAKETFKVEQEGALPITQRFQRIFRACIQDHRYNLSPIEKAFGSEFEESMKMFNPIQNDTKVAVTTTTVRANISCILSNYNGEKRFNDGNYHHIRARNYGHDISISDAYGAACTSAAPFFFKSKDVRHLDTFQDGGLRHNNPAFITSWECARLWPKRCQIFKEDPCGVDYMISLGTGATSSAKYEVGPHSPKTDRFFGRLFGSYMHIIAGQEQWDAFINCVPPKNRHRFHRLNVYYPNSEPALNDVAAIERLKGQAEDSLIGNPILALAKDSMIASMFHFELDNISRLEGGGYQCLGNIFCRLPMDSVGRKALYENLQDSRAVFLVNTRPIPCVNLMPEGIPPFRCTFGLTVKSMEDEIRISIRNITTQATMISGMPAKLIELVEAQGLIAPFGRIDKMEVERELPDFPPKRRFHEI